MNKRLLKRHKRQVSRARETIRLSEPDVRTPEQVKAAREASRPTVDWRTGADARYSTPAKGPAETADAALQPVPESVPTASQPDSEANRDGHGAGPKRRYQRGKEVL